MELFFPLIGVFAVIVAGIAATVCILIPGPKHLVTRVFFGTIGFIFGGAVSTAIVAAIIAMSIYNIAPSFTAGKAVITALVCITYVLLGTASSWATVKFINSLFESLSYGRRTSHPATSDGPVDEPNQREVAGDGTRLL